MVKARQIIALDDHAQGGVFHRYLFQRHVEHLANGRPFRADDLRAGNQRSEPMEEVQQLLPAYAREEILRPAGESDDLVRKHGSADHHVVVIEDSLVDRHVDIAGELAAVGRNLRGDIVAGKPPHAGQDIRVLPLVVEDIAAGQNLRPPARLDIQELVDHRIGHRRVRTECDQEIEFRGLWSDHLVEQAGNLSQRAGAGMVGDNDEDSLAGRGDFRGDISNDAGDLLVGKCSVNSSCA